MKKEPIQIMKAHDMFNPDRQQEFNRKTGQRLNYGYDPEIFEQEPEPEEEETPSPNQLNLF